MVRNRISEIETMILNILAVEESTSGFFVSFIGGRVRWRAKGMAGGRDTKVTREQYGGQFSSSR